MQLFNSPDLEYKLMENNYSKTTRKYAPSSPIKTILIFLILNSIILLGVLGTIIYGFCYLLPEKIEGFSSLLNNFGQYGNDIDEFSTKFNEVYGIILSLCNKTKLCT